MNSLRAWPRRRDASGAPKPGCRSACRDASSARPRPVAASKWPWRSDRRVAGFGADAQGVGSAAASSPGGDLGDRAAAGVDAAAAAQAQRTAARRARGGRRRPGTAGRRCRGSRRSPRRRRCWPRPPPRCLQAHSGPSMGVLGAHADEADRLRQRRRASSSGSSCSGCASCVNVVTASMRSEAEAGCAATAVGGLVVADVVCGPIAEGRVEVHHPAELASSNRSSRRSKPHHGPKVGPV